MAENTKENKREENNREEKVCEKYKCGRCGHLCYENKKESWNEKKKINCLMCEECIYRVHMWGLNNDLKSEQFCGFKPVQFLNTEVIGKINTIMEILEFYKRKFPNGTIEIKIEEDPFVRGSYGPSIFVNGKPIRSMTRWY